MSTDGIATWEVHWSKGDIPWQLPEVNPRLLTNMEELVGRLGGSSVTLTNGEAAVAAGETDAVIPRTILVPLCGKSQDLIALWRAGHTVAGCEWVEAGCVQFFTENNIAFTRTPLQQVEGSLFQSEDGRLRIYQCDFLTLSADVVDLRFDAVWDVQSLVSINPRDRKQYVRAVRSLLKDEFRYLLVTVEYEPFAHLGRPHSISYNAVKELFGSFSNIKFVAQLPASPPLKPAWKENVFSLTPGIEDRVQYWQARWATGQTQWHSDKPHKYLVKYMEELTKKKSKPRILLPLCGKAGDIMWLYRQGHTVLGVEGVPFVVEQFFRENKLEHDKIAMPELNGWRFRSKDGRLTIYACDFFLMTPEILGPVDAVYDNGALEVVNPQDRASYARVMQSLLGPDFRYILNAYEYDDMVFQGPPRHLPRDEVFQLFEEFAEVDILEDFDAAPEDLNGTNLEWMFHVVFLIHPRQHMPYQ